MSPWLTKRFAVFRLGLLKLTPQQRPFRARSRMITGGASGIGGRWNEPPALCATIVARPGAAPFRRSD